MAEHTEVFVGLDVAKSRHAVAVADDGRNGEIRYLGGSCPLTWYKSVVVITLSGGGRPVCQSATAGKLTMEVSLRGAMVSSVM